MEDPNLVLVPVEVKVTLKEGVVKESLYRLCYFKRWVMGGLCMVEDTGIMKGKSGRLYMDMKSKGSIYQEENSKVLFAFHIVY